MLNVRKILSTGHFFASDLPQPEKFSKDFNFSSLRSGGNSTLFLITTVFIAAALGAIFFVTNGKLFNLKESPADTSSMAGGTKEETDISVALPGWKLFEDKKTGVSFYYPGGLTPKSVQQSDQVINNILLEGSGPDKGQIEVLVVAQGSDYQKGERSDLLNLKVGNQANISPDNTYDSKWVFKRLPDIQIQKNNIFVYQNTGDSAPLERRMYIVRPKTILMIKGIIKEPVSEETLVNLTQSINLNNL